MLPSNRDRVPSNTAESLNEAIHRKARARVARYYAAGPEAIDRRLAELDREWDVERWVETMAPSLTLTGLVLGTAGRRRWLLLSAAVQAFFLQHALQGWCPPIPVLRRLGVRTQSEIDQERYALKALRGDFRNVEGPGATGRAFEAAAP